MLQKSAGLSNEARTFYWYRGTLVNLVCVALSAAFTGYAHSAGEHMREASSLIDGQDRSANLRVIGLLFGMSLVVSFYGLAVQFTLARQGGRPGGGNMAPFGYSYSATSALLSLTMLVSFVLNAWLAMTGFSTIVRIGQHAGLHRVSKNIPPSTCYNLADIGILDPITFGRSVTENIKSSHSLTRSSQPPNLRIFIT